MEQISRAQHPLWSLLEHQERSLAWLGRRMGYSRQYVRMVRAGQEPLRPEFRSRAAAAMGLPEAVLFVTAPTAIEPEAAVA